MLALILSVFMGQHHHHGYWSQFKYKLTKYCQTGETYWGTYTHAVTPTHLGTVSSWFPKFTKFIIPHYGYGREEDRGNFGSGQLDLYDPNCAGDIQWGVKWEKIYIYTS